MLGIKNKIKSHCDKQIKISFVNLKKKIIIQYKKLYVFDTINFEQFEMLHYVFLTLFNDKNYGNKNLRFYIQYQRLTILNIHSNVGVTLNIH